MDKAEIYLANDTSSFIEFMKEKLNDSYALLGSMQELVNDSYTFLEYIETYLTGKGYRVTKFKKDVDLYQDIKETRPRLIVIDIQIERPNTGLKLIQRLKADQQLASIPIIICARDFHSSAARGEYLKYDDCWLLEKPFRLEAIAATVEDVLVSVPQYR
jgi:DNA-binding response OmpR family regulator